MAKAENKTKPTLVDPRRFISGLPDGPRKRDAAMLLAFFERETGLQGQMWGPSIVGFGRYHYKYESGREGFSLMTGFSPRKQDLVIYVVPGFEQPNIKKWLAVLGRHKTGKSCLYLKSLEDIDMDVLARIVSEGVRYVRQNYQTWAA